VLTKTSHQKQKLTKSVKFMNVFLFYLKKKKHFQVCPK